MRYTTLIDIREQPRIYGNIHARLVYLHMVLAAGYHDNDRDMLRYSIRSLAADVGCSVSAVRHALLVLQKSGLLTRHGDLWQVQKFVLPEDITPRPKTQRKQKEQEIKQVRQDQDAAREKEMHRQKEERERLQQQGKTPFMAYYEIQQAKAAAGDIDAQTAVKKYKKQYEIQQQAINKRNNDS